MKNFSDGKSDGLALFYIKDGRLYPVAVAVEELELLDIMIPTIIAKAMPVLEHPICKVGVGMFNKLGE